MDTLHDRLAELADDAPTGGAPPAELWVRGKRAHRLRAATLAATLLVVAVVGAGIGLRHIDGTRTDPPAARQVRLALPIDYPVGTELPDLGETPGRLAAIWLVPGVGGGAPEAVGLVADTGTFGTLPIDASASFFDGGGMGVALSPDGRRVSYDTPTGGLVVRDLVRGQSYSPAFAFGIRAGSSTWIDATHLVGHVADGSDIDGWVWEPGTAPKVVNLLRYPGSPWLGQFGGRDPWFNIKESASTPPCSSPPAQTTDKPVLCDVVGVTGSGIVLTHWNSEVVALARTDFPFDDPAQRHVVVTAGAPERVAFATDVIGDALGGAS